MPDERYVIDVLVILFYDEEPEESEVKCYRLNTKKSKQWRKKNLSAESCISLVKLVCIFEVATGRKASKTFYF